MDRSCDNCQSRRNETCTDLFSTPCDDFRAVPSIDTEILKAASLKHDAILRGHTRKCDSITPASNTEFNSIYAGRRLFYKDKRTGEIESGIVSDVGLHSFAFKFEMRTIRLDYSVIKTRLFYTEGDARKYGKTQQDK